MGLLLRPSIYVVNVIPAQSSGVHMLDNGEKSKLILSLIYKFDKPHNMVYMVLVETQKF